MTSVLFKKRLRNALRRPHHFFSRWLFDPVRISGSMVNTARAIPVYARNVARYSRLNERPAFAVSVADAWFRSFDRFEAAGSVPYHYFHQDLWAARKLYDAGTRVHVDVASRIDGFVAHALTFCHITYVDVRPIDLQWEGFTFKRGLITDLPFADGSVNSLSSLHVIEHIGLGRYGDPVDPEGSWKAARELTRVLAPEGRLLIGVPTGRERVCFDAHRIFDPATIRDMFAGLELADFSFIDDENRFIRNGSFEDARVANYGCGLFEFRKP
jgi:SAM-dependent methyltransferase